MPGLWDSAVEWARERTERAELPSAVVGIATSAGGIEAVEAFGSTRGRVARPDDPFALFSMTKPMVGIATMRRVVAGDVRLDASLDAALDREARLPGVLLEHLLTHRSGMSDVPIDAVPPLRESLLEAKPDFEPGTRFRYTNLAFDGVGAIVEHSTGRDIWSHLDDLLGPHPQIGFDPSVGPHEVLGTESEGFDIERMWPHRHPAAGAIGTAPAVLDLGIRVLRAARGESDELLAPEAFGRMLEPRTTGLPGPEDEDPRTSEYGLTWNLPHRTRVFGHAGWSGTQWWMRADTDTVLVMLTNRLDAGDRGVDFQRLIDLVDAD